MQIPWPCRILIAGDYIKMAKSLMPGDLAIIRIILDLFIVQIPIYLDILISA